MWKICWGFVSELGYEHFCGKCHELWKRMCLLFVVPYSSSFRLVKVIYSTYFLLCSLLKYLCCEKKWDGFEFLIILIYILIYIIY